MKTRYGFILIVAIICGPAVPTFCPAAAPEEVRGSLEAQLKSLSDVTLKTTYNYSALMFHSPGELEKSAEKAEAQFTVYTRGDNTRIELLPVDEKNRTILISNGTDFLTRVESEAGVRESFVEDGEPSLNHFSPKAYLAGTINMAKMETFLPAASDPEIENHLVLEKTSQSGDGPRTTVEFSLKPLPAMTSFQAHDPAGNLVSKREFSEMTNVMGAMLPRKVVNTTYREPDKPGVIIEYTEITYEKLESPPQDLFSVKKSEAPELRGMQRALLAKDPTH